MKYVQHVEIEEMIWLILAKTPRGAAESPAQPRSSRRRQSVIRDADTTNLLLDFTGQFDGPPKSSRDSPSRRSTRSPLKATTEPNLLSYINNQRMPSPNKGQPTTPMGKRNILNLLDFDLPPQPTPRSIPSISVRELESLKSSYLSEISSLKASLKGREAEVESLKRAVADAERRVGEALETVREERNAREYAEKEKQEWEKKGKEVESVLNSVREEFLSGEKEREDLLQKLDDADRLRAEAEERHALLASKSVAGSGDAGKTDTTSPKSSPSVAELVARQLDEKMENLARELHAVYKKKHESKVATLKKTYEARAEKRCHELHLKIQELTNQNTEAQSSHSKARDAAAERVDAQRLEEQKAEIEEQATRISRLVAELDGVKVVYESVLQELKTERMEKGELVAAVDEMLALQQEVGAPMQGAIEDFRRSLSRPSGLRAPSASESRISRFGAPAPPRVGAGGKSRMMSNIERMGGGRVAE